MDRLDRLLQLRLEAWEIKYSLWQQSFLTPQWWLIAIIVAVFYAAWWKYVDKRRIVEILLFGSFIAVARIIIDNWGISSGRWIYVTDLVPLGYSLFLNDLTVVPLAYMLAYQFSPSWTRYLVVVTVLQGIFSFVVLPSLIALGILRLDNWQYANTFLLMLLTAAVMRAIILFGLQVEASAAPAYKRDTPQGGLTRQPAMKPLESEDDEKE